MNDYATEIGGKSISTTSTGFLWLTPVWKDLPVSCICQEAIRTCRTVSLQWDASYDSI